MKNDEPSGWSSSETAWSATVSSSSWRRASAKTMRGSPRSALRGDPHRRGAAPGLRPRRPLDLLRRPHARGDDAAGARAIRGSRASPSASMRARPGSTARGAWSSSREGRCGGPGPGDRRTTGWSWRPARRRSCRRSRGATPPGCFVYRTIEDLEAIRGWAARTRRRRRRRHRRRAARPRGGVRAREAGDEGARHRVRAAPHGAAARRDRRRRAAPADRGPGRRRPHRDVDQGDPRPRRRGRPRAGRCASPTATSWTIDLLVFSAGIRPRDELARAAGLPIGERGGIVIDQSCRTEDRGDLRHRRVRLLRGALLRPGRARLPDGARGDGGPLPRARGDAEAAEARRRCLHRLRHEHQAQVDGGRRGQLRRRLRQPQGRARRQPARHQRRALQEAGPVARSQAPPRRDAGRRRQQPTASSCSWRRTRSCCRPSRRP